MHRLPSRLRFTAVAGASILLAGCATTPSAPPPAGRVEVVEPTRHDSSPPLRSLTPLAPRAAVADRVHPVRRLPPLPRGRAALSADPVRQASATRSLGVTATSFEGIGTGLPHPVRNAPSDSTGAAGRTQYVQWVNVAFAVFDKEDGGLVYGPAAGRTLWAGFGGRCEDENDGDPIVLYDQLADRWLLTQFAIEGGPPFFQCVAVSTTSDATGTYSRYAFPFDALNDYPKFGIWPDGYYVSFNMFGLGFLGGKVCALERDKMLAGESARMLCFDVDDGGLLPSDLDGSEPPPPGTPNHFLALGPDRLDLWRFEVDWADPEQSRLTGPEEISVPTFESACPTGQACIPQPPPTSGGQAPRLDSLGDRLMYRLAYRSNGEGGSLVVNHSVTEPSTGASAVRWYELRNVGESPVVHQAGTFAPDGTSRWMGSLAMDKVGNIAVGYSVSSTSVAPSIRFTGRRAGDPAGELAMEGEIVAGDGTQSLERWGDYSSLTLDPVDDCTFWYTTQYMKNEGQFNWQTRVAHFRFPGCQ